MAHITPPPDSALPSPARLRRFVVFAAVTILVLIVVVVLPAEKAIDITGIGRLIGLTEMGQVKRELAEELATDSAFRAIGQRADSVTAAEEAAALKAFALDPKVARVDTTDVIVPPGEERAIRLRMNAKAWVIYSWSTDRGVVEDDTRGDSAGVSSWWYYRYHSGKPRSANNGALVAKFNGLHGWYWKNATDSAVTVRLVTRGVYSGIVGKTP
jgi:hypothetical protein